MNLQCLFAEKIGGENSRRIQQTITFTTIKGAKKAFISKKPSSKLKRA